MATIMGLSACTLVKNFGIFRTPALRLKHTLPNLSYEYNALEPIISAEIMTLHHSKHHAAYVNNLNIAEGKLKDAINQDDIKATIALQPALKFNGGGHINHTLFWKMISPKGGGLPSGELLQLIKRDFGSFDDFKTEITTLSVNIQGSGWGWLGFNTKRKLLQLASTPNQDPLFPTTGLVPLLGIDVWEHAYYLQYKNVRADYVNAIFNVINWGYVAKRYEDIKLGA
uniref:Superoxide dismutase n=1 Tax=Hemiscolopendra marginata TaxID=943146 RepID=A0A646QJ55_9MYRI